MYGGMIAPKWGYVATLAVARPLNDMARVAGRSSSNGRGVMMSTVDRFECADYGRQNEMTQVARSSVAR
jgi:hypothetical protein